MKSSRLSGMSIAFACAFLAPILCAEVLVYEGFHPEDYGNVADNGMVTISTYGPTGNHTIGITNIAWNGNNTGYVKAYGANYGLALPAEMTGAGFSSLGGSIGLNPELSKNRQHRGTIHYLAGDVLKKSSGKFYIRVLLNLDSTAAGSLNPYSSFLVPSVGIVLPYGAYFGFGFGNGQSLPGTAGTNVNDGYLAPTSMKSALSFAIWKNSSSQYVLSLVHTTSSYKNGKTLNDFPIDLPIAHPIITGITLGKTYVCYAEVNVGAGSDGKEIIRAGAMACDAYEMRPLWAKLDGESETIEVDLMNDSVYPTCMAVSGPYGTAGGYFRADEVVVGTELGDILAYTPRGLVVAIK